MRSFLMMMMALGAAGCSESSTEDASKTNLAPVKMAKQNQTPELPVGGSSAEPQPSVEPLRHGGDEKTKKQNSDSEGSELHKLLRSRTESGVFDMSAYYAAFKILGNDITRLEAIVVDSKEDMSARVGAADMICWWHRVKHMRFLDTYKSHFHDESLPLTLRAFAASTLFEMPGFIGVEKQEECGDMLRSALKECREPILAVRICGGFSAQRALVEEIALLLLSDNVNVADAAADALGGGSIQGEPQAEVACPLLCAALTNPQCLSRPKIAEAIGSLKVAPDLSTGALISALEIDDDNIKKGAAEGLGRLGDDRKEVIEALARNLNPGNWLVGNTIVESIGKIGGDHAKLAVPQLVNYLQNNDEFLPSYVIFGAFSKIGSDARSAVPAIIAFLDKDASPSHRHWAARALGAILMAPDAKEDIPKHLSDPACKLAVAELSKHVADNDEEVAAAARKALATISGATTEAADK